VAEITKTNPKIECRAAGAGVVTNPPVTRRNSHRRTGVPGID